MQHIAQTIVVSNQRQRKRAGNDNDSTSYHHSIGVIVACYRCNVMWLLWSVASSLLSSAASVVAHVALLDTFSLRSGVALGIIIALNALAVVCFVRALSMIGTVRAVAAAVAFGAIVSAAADSALHDRSITAQWMLGVAMMVAGVALMS